MAKGDVVDFSWARPGAAAFAGKKGVMRYLSWDTTGKNLDSSEMAEYLGAGLAVGVVWEFRAKPDWTAGQSDGAEARRQANALGFPADWPIYFAEDYDAPESDQPNIDQYGRDFKVGIGGALTGPYGGYWVCKRCRENGSADIFWQTYAWSGGNVLDGINLYQYANGAGPGGSDLNETFDGIDWFGWNGSGGSPTQPDSGGGVAPVPQPDPGSNVIDTYTVQAGDNLTTIAAKYPQSDVTAKSIAVDNNIANPSLIQPGQSLVIRSNEAAATPPDHVPAPPPAPEPGTYTVESGDTLSSIGAAYGMSWQTLYNANTDVIGSNPNVIRPGQVLTIPGNATPPTEVAPAYRTYTVEAGDNLTRIAAQYPEESVTADTIAALNGLPNADFITPGQVLNIPN